MNLATPVSGSIEVIVAENWTALDSTVQYCDSD